MRSGPFVATHALFTKGLYGGEGWTRTEVALAPDGEGLGPAYTQEEWEAGGDAAWRRVGRTEWTYHGQGVEAFELRVEGVPGRAIAFHDRHQAVLRGLNDAVAFLEEELLCPIRARKENSRDRLLRENDYVKAVGLLRSLREFY